MEQVSRSLHKVRVEKLGDLEEPDAFSPGKQDFQLLVAHDDLLVRRVLETKDRMRSDARKYIPAYPCINLKISHLRHRYVLFQCHHYSFTSKDKSSSVNQPSTLSLTIHSILQTYYYSNITVQTTQPH